MKVTTVYSEQVESEKRLDSWYFLSAGNTTVAMLRAAKSNGLEVRKLGGPNGLTRVWKPARSKMFLAVPDEPAVPYLRPYDVFNYFPEPSDWLSKLRTDALDDYKLQPGMILQTCSGRNLGPSVIVDRYLAQFVVGADMIRLETADNAMRNYLWAVLKSQSGRNLLRRYKTGSVIDHLDPDDLSEIEIPLLQQDQIRTISTFIHRATQLREEGRLTLQEKIRTYEHRLPPLKRIKHLREGWTVMSNQITGRLDAAFHDPLVTTIRELLIQAGGRCVAEFADTRKPAGRYKTCYVERDHGRPLLSGGQLLQAVPINLQFMSLNVFKDLAKYELHTGWIAYPADGRAEEELGTPVVITRDRDGWLASGHVGRIVPKAGVDVGWLFLALKTRHAQMQLKARSSGSVVDSTFSEDMEGVVLPPQRDLSGADILKVWDNFWRAQTFEDEAVSLIDRCLRGFMN